MKHFYAVTLVSLLLTACGGSGGNDTSGPSSPPAPPPVSGLAQSLTVSIPDSITQYQAIGIAVSLSNNHIAKSVQWRQLSGPQLNLTSAKSQVMGLDMNVSGDYQFEVTVTSNNDEIATKQLSFTVLASDSPQAVVRQDHTVVTRGKASLRADVNHSSEAVDSVSWKQIAGPSVTLNQSQSPFLFFDAPSVSQDRAMMISGV